LWTDHPFAILNAPWVDTEKRAAAETFRAFLMERPQQELALKLGFRPGDPSIPIGAPIDPANGVDPAQPKTLLEVPSAEVLEAVRAVWVQNKKHVDVMAVLDISGSMREEDRIEKAKAALQIFARQLADADGFGLTVFSDGASVLTPISPIGPKRQQILDQIGGLFPQGGTRLYDTVGEAYRPLLSAPPDQRIRALIVLTDGADTKSTMPFNQLLQEIRQDQEGRSIKVFTIAFGGDAQVELLKNMAEVSGARSYTGKPNEAGNIEQVYRDIATFF
jgi:Ca-activated chloride channel homolog